MVLETDGKGAGGGGSGVGGGGGWRVCVCVCACQPLVYLGRVARLCVLLPQQISGGGVLQVDTFTAARYSPHWMNCNIWPAAFAVSFDAGQGSKCGVPPLRSLTSPGR